MAIPSGSGTEVLYRTTIKTLVDGWTAFRWDRTNATTGTKKTTEYKKLSSETTQIGSMQFLKFLFISASI